ncbi:MAG: hypothetical protein HUU60_03530 [Armatimonadetes bacterium]|nr:hypothetical protein [Armatimonadota bacterium]
MVGSFFKKTGFMVVLSVCLIVGASAQTGGGFDLTWNTIDGGGITFATGGAFKMGGTVGQPDATGANALSGGAFTLTGGFWRPRLAGDVNWDGCVDDTDLAIVLGGFGGTGLGDENDDGIIDDTDLAIVLSNFGLGC